MPKDTAVHVPMRYMMRPSGIFEAQFAGSIWAEAPAANRRTTASLCSSAAGQTQREPHSCVAEFWTWTAIQRSRKRREALAANISPAIGGARPHDTRPDIGRCIWSGDAGIAEPAAIFGRERAVFLECALRIASAGAGSAAPQR